MTTATALKDKLKVRNRVTFTTTGNYVMGDEGYLSVKKASGAATQVTLVKSPEDGDFVFIKDGKGDAATNNITIIPDGVSVTTVDGTASYVISENYGAVLLSYNGSEWQVKGAYKENISQGGLTVTNGAVTNLTTTNGTVTNLTTTNGTVTNLTTTNGTVTNLTSTNGTVTNLTATNSTVTTSNATTLNVAGITTDSDVAILAATGTVIGNAASLTHAITVVTGADDAKGVVLPTAIAGKRMEVYSSQGTNGLKIYPPVNGTVNDGTANTAIVIEGKTLARFLGTSASNWAADYTVNA